jgi:hypothetical protein
MQATIAQMLNLLREGRGGASGGEPAPIALTAPAPADDTAARSANGD